MIRLALNKLGYSALLLMGLATLAFFVVRLAPGDPAVLYGDEGADPDAVAAMREQLGLDRPIGIQYLRWLGLTEPYEGILQGQWGVSISKHEPVFDAVARAVPNTLLLAVSALLVDYLLGIWLGVVMARTAGRRLDKALTAVGMFIYSMPAFWLSLMAILVFSLWLGWLPATQMNSRDVDQWGLIDQILDRIRHLILPVCVLGIPAAAATARYVRYSVKDTFEKPHIRAARAKGLPESRVMCRHVLPNACLPLITLFGLTFPFLLGGSVIVETIFAWPGMGRLTVEAIYGRDYPVIMATTMIGGAMVVMGNLLADVLYGLADPRVRLRARR